MRRIYCWVMALILGLALIPIPGAAAASDSWTLSSADGRIQITLFLSNSSLCYTASMDGIPVLGQSRLGLYTAMADFTYGVSVTSAERNSFRETYPMLTGKASSYTNDYTELVLTVEKEGHQMRVYARAYGDGFAIRYGLSENTKVLTEATQFNLGSAQAVHAQEYEKCYEAFYEKRKMQDMFGLYAMPALAWLENGSYALITEAALNGSYCGSVLRSTGDGVLRTEFEPKQTEMVEIEAQFTSPWRAVVLGDANTIASTQMPENLNPPCAISDTSWIKPGVSAWTWFNGDPVSYTHLTLPTTSRV